MKTKEEIEQLAAREYWRNNVERRSFIIGYTQCQEDNANKKYTEEDLRIAFDTGYYTRDSFGDRPDNMTDEDYINSLNKQD